MPRDVIIKTMTAGGKHSMVLSSDGGLYTFGYGQQGQLGHRSAKNIFKPKFVQDFLGKKIKLITAGQNHSLALTQAGDLFVCGSNTDGQLGLGDTEMRTSFQHLRTLADKNIYRIFAGGNHSWVLLDEIIPMRNNVRPPSPLYGERVPSPKNKSPQKDSNSLAVGGGASISLTNQAA